MSKLIKAVWVSELTTFEQLVPVEQVESHAAWVCLAFGFDTEITYVAPTPAERDKVEV